MDRWGNKVSLHVQIDPNRFSFAFTFALCKYLPGTTLLTPACCPFKWMQGSRHRHFSIPPGAAREIKTLLRKPQVSLTVPKTNGLWLTAVTNSQIIDFMILRLKLLYNNTQKCLMGSSRSHKNYLLNKCFKTINLLFSINNGSPKNRRQFNVPTAFLLEKWPFNTQMLLPRHHSLAGHWAADHPRTDLGFTSSRRCYKNFQNKLGPWEVLVDAGRDGTAPFLNFSLFVQKRRLTFQPPRWNTQREVDCFGMSLYSCSF